MEFVPTVESPYLPEPEPEVQEETIEEVEELSRLEKSQHALAEAKADLMRPGLVGWILKKRNTARYEEAQAENIEAQAQEFREQLTAFEEDENILLDAEEVRQAAVVSVIENKNKIDELAVSEEYAGKTSNKFVSMVRNSGSGTKFGLSFGGSLLSGWFVWPINGYLVSQLGRKHVADNAGDIQKAEKEVSEQLQKQMTERDAYEMEMSKYRELQDEAAKAIETSMWHQRDQVKKQVGPIVVGTLLGSTGNAALNASTHL